MSSLFKILIIIVMLQGILARKKHHKKYSDEIDSDQGYSKEMNDENESRRNESPVKSYEQEYSDIDKSEPSEETKESEEKKEMEERKESEEMEENEDDNNSIEDGDSFERKHSRKNKKSKKNRHRSDEEDDDEIEDSVDRKSSSVKEKKRKSIKKDLSQAQVESSIDPSTEVPTVTKPEDNDLSGEKIDPMNGEDESFKEEAAEIPAEIDPSFTPPATTLIEIENISMTTSEFNRTVERSYNKVDIISDYVLGVGLCVFLILMTVLFCWKLAGYCSKRRAKLRNRRIAKARRDEAARSISADAQDIEAEGQVLQEIPMEPIASTSAATTV